MSSVDALSQLVDTSNYHVNHHMIIVGWHLLQSHLNNTHINILVSPYPPYLLTSNHYMLTSSLHRDNSSW